MRQKEAGWVVVTGLVGKVDKIQIQLNPSAKKGKVNYWRHNIIADLSVPRGTQEHK